MVPIIKWKNKIQPKSKATREIGIYTRKKDASENIMIYCYIEIYRYHHIVIKFSVWDEFSIQFFSFFLNAINFQNQITFLYNMQTYI